MRWVGLGGDGDRGWDPVNLQLQGPAHLQPHARCSLQPHARCRPGGACTVQLKGLLVVFSGNRRDT